MNLSGSYSSATAANTVYTAPTIVLSDDLAPAPNAKQSYVSALSGTGKTTEDPHTADKPFTVTLFRPANYRRQGPVNPNTGVSVVNPSNEYRLVIRKGVDTTGGVPGVAIIRLSVTIPAGSETGDPLNLDMLTGMLRGFLFDQGVAFASVFKSGVI